MRSAVVVAVAVSVDAAVVEPAAATEPPPGPIVYTGEMGDEVPDARYPVAVQAGQAMRVTVTASSGDLDPYLILEDPDGAVVAENDDRDATTLDSYLVHTASVAGEYVVIVSNIDGTAGAYAVTIEVGSSDRARRCDGPAGVLRCDERPGPGCAVPVHAGGRSGGADHGRRDQR